MLYDSKRRCKLTASGKYYYCSLSLREKKTITNLTRKNRAKKQFKWRRRRPRRCAKLCNVFLLCSFMGCIRENTHHSHELHQRYRWKTFSIEMKPFLFWRIEVAKKTENNIGNCANNQFGPIANARTNEEKTKLNCIYQSSSNYFDAFAATDLWKQQSNTRRKYIIKKAHTSREFHFSHRVNQTGETNPNGNSPTLLLLLIGHHSTWTFVFNARI